MFWIKGVVILSLFAAFQFSSQSEAQERHDVRIFAINGTKLYFPISWKLFSLTYRREEIETKPQGYIFRENRGLQVGLVGLQIGDLGRPDRNPLVPRPEIPWNDFYVGLTDFDTISVNPLPYKKRHADGITPPPHINCDPTTYGQKRVFDYCDASREALDGIRIRYRWSGRLQPPTGWQLMDRRIQKIVEWLAAPPTKRPAQVPE